MEQFWTKRKIRKTELSTAKGFVFVQQTGTKTEERKTDDGFYRSLNG